MSSPYERIKSIVFSFVKDKDLLYKLYGVYLSQTKYLKEAYRESELINAAVYSLRTAFNKTKTKKIRNIAGYFNGIFSNTLTKLYEESVEEMHSEGVETEDIKDTTVQEKAEDTSEIYSDIHAQLAIWRDKEPSNI